MEDKKRKLKAYEREVRGITVQDLVKFGIRLGKLEAERDLYKKMLDEETQEKLKGKGLRY